jgi:type IV secretion system protein VirB9
MRRFALLMTLALGFAGPVLALQQPAPGQRDARVRMVTYDPANVVRLNGVIRASTQIVFADDEEIAHVAIGDAVAWEVAPAGSILFLKPREKHSPTNLQVVTTRPDGRKRSYQFELSIAETTLADSYFVVRFAYPGDEIERRPAPCLWRAQLALFGSGLDRPRTRSRLRRRQGNHIPLRWQSRDSGDLPDQLRRL